MGKSIWIWLLALPLILLAVLAARELRRQDDPDQHLTRTPKPLAEIPADAPKDPHIVISVPDRTLAIVKDGSVVASYPIAVGKTSTPTPTGEFHISDLEANPASRTGVFGTRWMEFFRNKTPDGQTLLYGIHGTNEPAAIGNAVSHGCIRMRNNDVERVFQQAYPGELVEVLDTPIGVKPAA